MFYKIKEYLRQSNHIEQDKEFYELYNNIKQDIADIEIKRKILITKVVKLYIILIITVFLLFNIKSKVNILSNIEILFIIITIFLTVTNFLKFIKFQKEYINKYKNDILIKVIQRINNDEVYFSEAGIGINEYLEAGFETTSAFNEYKSSDYRGIKTENNIINLANIELNKKSIVPNTTITTDGFGNSEINVDVDETNINIFKGIYSYIYINKKIEEICITRSSQNIINKKEQIILDNQCFEEYFNVFSKNRMLTMQILTPQLMEKMLEFINETYINFKIIIKNEKIHFKFYTQMVHPKFYFVFGINNRINSIKKYIYYYYCLFKFIIDITNYLSRTINESNI